jgi:hypothetical protein
MRKSTFLWFLGLSFTGCILLGFSLIAVMATIFTNPVQFQSPNKDVVVSFALFTLWVLFCGTCLYIGYIFSKAIPKALAFLEGGKSNYLKIQKASQALLIIWMILGNCFCLWRLLKLA